MKTGPLFEWVQNGNAVAVDVLVCRYRPRLMRYATGHVPRGLRSTHNTDDLVQDSNHVPRFTIVALSP